MIGICAKPLIELMLYMGTYYFVSAVCEPIADERIVTLLSKIGDVFKIFTAIMFSMSFAIIIGITLILKISNSTVMLST